MANPLFDPGAKIFTGEYGKYRNLGKENKSSITNWQYEWANLSIPQGIGDYDEEDLLIHGEKKSRAKLHDIVVERDYPKND